MTRKSRQSVVLTVLIASLAGGGALMTAPAAEADGNVLSALSSLPTASVGIIAAPPALWWGTLQVARGGTDLLTATITPQLGPGPSLPGLGVAPQWTVFGTWNRVCTAQQNFVAGTMGSDGRTTLVFFAKLGAPDPNQQVAVGSAGVGEDGHLHGTVTVIQGPDLGDTFSFDLSHQ